MIPSIGIVFTALTLAVNVATAADPETGKKVYSQKCASCHGADGKGNATMEERLKAKIPSLASARQMADADLHKVLMDGKKPMPSFKNLSSEEMDAVIAYVKSLGSTTGK